MSGVNETIHTVNSAVRTLLFATLVGGAAFAGWTAYSVYNAPNEKLNKKQQQLEAMRERLAETEDRLAAQSKESKELTARLELSHHEIDRLETSLHLLKLNHRIARLHVVDQSKDPETGQLTSTVEFYEISEDGARIGPEPRRFEIEGNRVYVECLVVKFEDRYVEQADLDRSTAICLFQRIFGEHQQPLAGYELDVFGVSPTAYSRNDKMTEFEETIWSDFWTLANDPQKAAELGIRAAHADAPSIEVDHGATYELELRATGEFTLRRIQPESAASATWAG